MRADGGPAEFRVAFDSYVVTCVPDGLPSLYERYIEHAALSEAFDLHARSRCCVTVRRVQDSWPYLVVAQGFSPAGVGFEPGLLLEPTAARLFVGAGERLLAYDLLGPSRLWQDSAEIGFLGWERHGDVVLMSAELELAAWSTSGTKLWTTFVEPPWSYSVDEGVLTLDVMGSLRAFPLRAGPQ